jgi:hypothetical protein
MTYIRFLFDAAKRRAEDAGLTVISICPAALPVGIPSRDHYGNYVKAETVYIGKPGTIEKNCAYGRSVYPIHQIVAPGIAEGLADIAESLQNFQTFKTRAAYEDYYRSGCRGAADIDSMAQAWRDYVTTAERARRCLPPDLFAWLASGRCYC